MLLPPDLNACFSEPGTRRITGAVLHTKFLSDAPDRARTEKHRGEHFTHPDRFEAYYNCVASSPDLWRPGAETYSGWQQLEELELLDAAGWDP